MNLLVKLLWRDKWRLVLIFIFSILSYFLTLYPTNQLNQIVDGIGNGQLTYDAVLYNIFILMIIGVVGYIIGAFKEYYVFIGYDSVISDLTYRMQQRVYQHTPVLFNRFSIGEVISRTTNDITEYIAPFFGYGLLSFFDGVLYNVLITGLIYTKSNGVFTLLVSLPMIIQTIYFSLQRRPQEALYQQMANINDKITEETLENVKGIRVIRTYQLLDKVRTSFVGKLKTYATTNEAYMKRTLIYQPLSTFSMAAAYIIAVTYGFYLIEHGQMTLGQLVTACVALALLQWPYTALASGIIAVVELKQGLQRMTELMSPEPVVNNDEAKLPFVFNEAIQFKNFNFSYDDKLVLKDINLSIPKGRTLGIIGKTGSGKSTLVKQLLRLYPISQQQLYIDHKDIHQYTTEDIRAHIGYAPQEYQLFSQSLKDNILFFRHDYQDKLTEVLTIADLDKDIQKFDKGMDTLVGENGVALSGGQKQRLGIARALLAQPDILILDDSLSAVDANTEKNIIDHIKNYRQDKTNIIVSHRISAIRHADNIVVLNQGEIIGMGTHDHLLNTCSWYAELNDYQNKEETNNETD